jgi:hypothetical protein
MVPTIDFLIYSFPICLSMKDIMCMDYWPYFVIFIMHACMGENDTTLINLSDKYDLNWVKNIIE